MKDSEPLAADLVPLHPEAPFTRPQRKILHACNAVYFQPQPDPDDLTFSARELVQATLPHQSPRGNLLVRSRHNSNYTLRIRPGYKTDPLTRQDVCIGYPYGNVPRLLLFWMTTEALCTWSRRLELDGTLAGFMRELGLDPGLGGRSSARHRLVERDYLAILLAALEARGLDYTVAAMVTNADIEVPILADPSPVDRPIQLAVPPDQLFTAMGYTDMWQTSRSGRHKPGLTCCHEEDLMNATSTFDRRIDHIFVRSGVAFLPRKAVGPNIAFVVGTKPSDKTLSGLWPSDHAGVFARMRLPVQKQQPHRLLSNRK